MTWLRFQQIRTFTSSILVLFLNSAETKSAEMVVSVPGSRGRFYEPGSNKVIADAAK
jgi:hypothetical protein